MVTILFVIMLLLLAGFAVGFSHRLNSLADEFFHRTAGVKETMFEQLYGYDHRLKSLSDEIFHRTAGVKETMLEQLYGYDRRMNDIETKTNLRNATDQQNAEQLRKLRIDLMQLQDHTRTLQEGNAKRFEELDQTLDMECVRFDRIFDGAFTRVESIENIIVYLTSPGSNIATLQGMVKEHAERFNRRPDAGEVDRMEGECLGGDLDQSPAPEQDRSDLPERTKIDRP